MKRHNISVWLAARPTVAIIPAKNFLQIKPKRLLALCLMLAVFGLASGQQSTAPAISFPISIQWAKQKGVTLYRLQIASDQFFHAIFFDGRVVGERYTVSDLPPGYYYWRAAPADSSTGRFSMPVRFFVSGGAVVATPVAEKSSRRARVRNTPGGRVH